MDLLVAVVAEDVALARLLVVVDQDVVVLAVVVPLAVAVVEDAEGKSFAWVDDDCVDVC